MKKKVELIMLRRNVTFQNTDCSQCSQETAKYVGVKKIPYMACTQNAKMSF